MKLFNKKNLSSLNSPPANAWHWRAGHFSSLRGFTLIELLIVIAILGILAAGILVAINPLGQLQKSRDAIRKTAIAQMANAIENYAVAHGGQYPNTNGQWYSMCTNWIPKGVNDWIPDLVNSGELKNLPTDPTRGTNTGNLTNSSAPSGEGTDRPYAFCYIYNSNGTDYKIAAHCSVESAPANAGDPFYKGHEGWSCKNYSYARYSPNAVTW